MRRKTLLALLFPIAALLFSISCNKEIDSLELPPFTVAPNPFAYVMRVYPASATGGTLRVLDGTEKILAESTLNPASSVPLAIDMSGYDNGLYYVELQTPDQRFILPVIKAE